jgi:hypothetical protein
MYRKIPCFREFLREFWKKVGRAILNRQGAKPPMVSNVQTNSLLQGISQGILKKRWSRARAGEDPSTRLRESFGGQAGSG